MLAWVLTLLRLPIATAFAVTVGLMAPADQCLGWGVVAVLWTLAALAELTDLLDGWAARRFATVSELGHLADPLCDSLARLTMFFSLALSGRLWIGVPLVMAGLDIVVAYIRVVLAGTGRRTAARISGKVKAVVQGAAVLAVVALAGPWGRETGNAQLWRSIVGWLVIATTVWSLIDYVRAGAAAVAEMARRR